MVSVLDPDPREPNLPKWAQETLRILRMRLSEKISEIARTDASVRAEAEGLPVWTTMETAPGISHAAFAVGSESVELELDKRTRFSLRWLKSHGALEINGCDEFAVLPNAANAVMLKPGRFR